MKLLMISPHLPHPSWGAGTRSFYVLRALAREHQLSLLALTDAPTLASLPDYHTELEKYVQKLRLVQFTPASGKRSQQLTSILRGRSYLLDSYMLPEMQQTISALLTDDQYDAVLVESVFLAGYHFPAAMPIIIDQHNIEYELLQRTFQRERDWLRKGYNWWESRQLKPAELERCRQARLVLVTSAREQLQLKRLIPRSWIEVVPNGVNIDAFNATGAGGEVPNRIVFTGTMNYYPNIDAALYFARHCWPLIRAHIPDATWFIVGKEPPPEVQRLGQLPGVTVTGAVPEVTSYLASAAVAIAPLLIGSGTRLKILEALSMRKAVVSSSVGCEGLDVISGTHLLVADQAETFARSVIDLLQHPDRRVALGDAGRTLVESQYSWESCGERLLSALKKL